jgi:phytoene dehydrogenase-like protein
VLLERSGKLGGRAATQVRGGVHFNLGPHALYCRGHAFRLLRELGVPFSGRFPDAARGLVLDGDSTHPIPLGLGVLLGSRLLGLREKWRLVRTLMALDRLDTRGLDRVPLQDWLNRAVGAGKAAALLRMFVRVGTYSDDPGRLSAGAALDQLKLGLAGNVWYLDGGWQTLVDGLRDAASGHGAEIRGGARVESVRDVEGGVAVMLAGGEELRGLAAVLAVGPDEACSLLGLPPDAPMARWASARIPVRASCLDVALERLPTPGRHVAFGLDRPLYYSVHSASAALAPEGVAVLHLMKNLGGGPESPSEAVEDELEALLDRLQPGWRDRVIERRFLPKMTVAHALPRAEEGGLSGRPGVSLRERPGVFLAGDWVGAEGLLADAAAASAEEAARRVLDAPATSPRQVQTRSVSHVGR